MKSILKSPFVRQSLLFAVLLGVALSISSVVTPDMSFASSFIDESDNPSIVSDATNGESDFKSIVKTLLDFALKFLGFVMVVMIIYAGVLYVTAAGNEANTEKAKKILLYSVIGTVLIFISFAFVNTLLGAASGGDASSGTSSGVAN